MNPPKTPKQAIVSPDDNKKEPPEHMWIESGWMGGEYYERKVQPPTPHIDRGPGFTHFHPAETCGCAYDPLPFKCPINQPGCVRNCGNYGCGN